MASDQFAEYAIGFLIPIFAAVIGLGISFYISIAKRRKKALVCPIGQTCDPVVRSEYSRFLGIPVEYIGVLYYSIIIVYGIFAAFAIHPLSAGFFAMTAAALLFSFYLTFIQLVTLRQFCSWCFASAGMCFVIFLSLLYLMPRSYEYFSETLASWNDLIVAVQLLGIAIALGSATLSQVFFYRFLSDQRISNWESSVLRSTSQVSWLGLAIVLISWFGLLLSDPEGYVMSSLVQAQIAIVVVLIATDAYTTLTIAPRLPLISFSGKHQHAKGQMFCGRRSAYAAGAVSVVSWYSLFVAILLSEYTVSFTHVFFFYIAALAVAIFASFIAERTISRRMP